MMQHPVKNLHGPMMLVVRRKKYLFYVFLFMLVFQGLPFGRELSVSEMLTEADAHDVAYERSTSFGFATTIVPLLFWLTTYTVCAIQILRTEFQKMKFCMKNSVGLSLFLVIMILDLIDSSSRPIVAINIVHYLGCLLLCFCAAQFSSDKVEVVIGDLSKALSIIILINVTFCLFYPEYGVSYEGRLKGITGNPNSLGMLGAISAWLAFVCSVWAMHIGQRFFYFLMFMLSGGVLYLTESMTSAVSMTFAVIVFLWVSFGRIKSKINILRVGLLAVVPVFLLFAGYLGEIMKVVGSRVGRTEDFSGRVNHWIDAVRLISSKPILGWGFDNHASAIRETGLATSHFHNGYLDVAVRAGIVGVVLLFLFLVRFSSPLRIHNKNLLILIVSFFSFMYFYNLTEVNYFSNRNEMWLIALFLYFYRERFLLRSSR